MGNISSGGRRNSSHHHHQQSSPTPPPPPPPLQPDVSANRYVFAAATPYPPQYPNPNPPHYYQYAGYYPPPPPAMAVPLPAPFDQHHHHHHHHHRTLGPNGSWAGPGGRYPYGNMPPPMVPPLPAPPHVVEHQKAVTIRNDVNIKKETLRVVPDEGNPGSFLVAFTFDATIAGSITVLFFAKEGFTCDLTPMKENLLEPVTVPFKEGLGQKFKQPSGTGIDFSMFKETELIKKGESEVYPLAVKAEASPTDEQKGLVVSETREVGPPNCQITQAVFEKEDGDYQVRVAKQILWVTGTRYELQEIYGIGNSVDGDFDGNDPGKECVICLSEPRDTTVLPCRHMCMCSECAKVLRFQTDRCPICRQPVQRLLEIKVNNNNNKVEKEQQAATTLRAEHEGMLLGERELK